MVLVKPSHRLQINRSDLSASLYTLDRTASEVKDSRDFILAEAQKFARNLHDHWGYLLHEGFIPMNCIVAKFRGNKR